jgi:tetratricopeptide (TPR) repeat protein
MSRTGRITRHPGACLLLLLAVGLSFPGLARGANRLIDLKTAKDGEGRTRLALLLQQKPRFSLSCAQPNQIQLSLFETTGAEGLAKTIAAKGKSITLEDEKASSGLRLAIHLPSTPRECEWKWIPREKVLLIEWAEAKESDAKVSQKTQPPALGALRFGVQNEHTRMVADLGQKPLWAMTSREEQVVSFRLPGASNDLKRSDYGPMKRLRRVALRKEGGDLEIKAELDSPPERVKVFWLKEGAKWVVDFYDKGPEKLDTALRFERRPDPEPEKSQPPKIAAVPKEKEPAVSPRSEKSEEAKSRENPSPSPDPAPVQAGPVRMKIAKEPSSEPVSPSKGAGDFRVDPKVRYAPPQISPDAAQASNLRPAEAILCGRIREALDAGDYEKGTGLIREFLSTYPGSPMTEEMKFLAADCRFALAERGDKSLYPEVIRSFLEVINTYPRSERVPGSLVKTARAHEWSGNDQEALGFLSIAIKQHPSGDHVPGALVARGRIYLRLNQPQRAVEDYKAVITHSPDSPLAEEAQFGIAAYYHGVGMYDDAESRLKGVIGKNPRFHLEHPEFLFLRARNYFYRKDYDLARENYLRGLNLGHQPETSDLLISHIGDTYHHQSKEREAEKLYRMALTYFPESEGAGIAKLRIADKGGGVADYEEIYKKNINKPIGELAILEMAGKFYKKGQYGLAVETLRKLTGKQAARSDIQREAKQLYFRCVEKEIRALYEAGQHEKVAEYFQTADPPLSGNIEPDTMMLVGESFHHRQLYPEAIRIFSQLNIRDLSPPSKGKYVIDFAKAYLEQGEEESARNLLENSSEENLPPADQQRATLLHAEICLKKGEMKRALDLLQSLLGEKRFLSDREMAGVYLDIGRLNNRQQFYEKARESLNRSIALAEKDRESRELLRPAFEELGNGYHREGRHQEAVRYYGKCLELDFAPEMKGYWEIKYRLALSYLGTGENNMAERIMGEIAEEGDPVTQQKAQMKMGLVTLEKELKRLPMGRKGE